MPTILITGASRGIGRRLAELYSAGGWEVISACRNPAGCDPVGEPLALDVGDAGSIAAAAKALSGRSIDVLWNNAGIYIDKGQALKDLRAEDWLESFRINTIAPIMLCRALLENVAASGLRKLAFTTSKMGSVALNSGGAYEYRSSKAALNMAVSSLAQELAPRGIRTVVLHPGWVRTDMGGAGADIDTTQSAAGMKSVVDGLAAGQTGQFFNYDGKELPW
ncbi:SDR family oxidoreductase [Rhodospirillaceae bacterium KN72]|uniref:SDR family oxidoreductase n=1 Tax=Pacificispira spongiicola TaxID=2729598 RepID=A0A7Y0E589_9PROT|nr:SDR family oxidoreductase [Pacificispira spongiicola]NMM46636.1 SDR family oxidoreductase [Pacificispira spongiicola]